MLREPRIGPAFPTALTERVAVNLGRVSRRCSGRGTRLQIRDGNGAVRARIASDDRVQSPECSHFHMEDHAKSR